MARHNRLDKNAAVGIECNKVEPAKGGGVFVLFPNRFSEQVMCDMKGSLGQVIFRNWKVKISCQSLQHPDANTGGRPNPRTARHFKTQKQLTCTIAPHSLP